MGDTRFDRVLALREKHDPLPSFIQDFITQDFCIVAGSTWPEDELQLRALNQAAREVLLAQSSDWAFIMRTGTMVPYAVRRTRSHLMRFHKLYDELKEGKVDSGWLEKVQEIDNIFPEINYRVYRSL